MSLIDINWNPSSRQLRQFGVACVLALPLIGWLWGLAGQTIGILVVIGCLLCVIGFAFPSLLKPVFVGLTVLVAPIGIVVGELTMLIIYYGVFLPMSIVFKILNRDALQLKIQLDRKSYWQSKKKPSSVASYFRQS